MRVEDLKGNGQRIVGFLGRNGALFCSEGCAQAAGEHGSSPLDIDELDALLEGNGPAVPLLCPTCGEPFPVSWPDRNAD